MQSGRVKGYITMRNSFDGSTRTFMRREANRQQRHKANIALRMLVNSGAFEE